MKELAIAVSLPLWRAVREGNLEDCRKLLQDQADPNLADGKGPLEENRHLVLKQSLTGLRPSRNRI